MRARYLSAAVAVAAVVLGMNALSQVRARDSVPVSADAECGPGDRVIHQRRALQEGSSYDVLLRAKDCIYVPFASSELDEYSPTISADGSLVAFVRGASGEPERQLVVASADGHDERVLVDSTQLIGGPAWAPDGESIAYWKDDGEGLSSIWAVSLPTADSMAVTSPKPGRAEYKPEWSPNGEQLAFVRSNPNGSQVVIVNSRTGAESEMVLGLGAGSVSSPTWSPDGSEIAFVRLGEDAGEIDSIGTIHISTGEVTELAETGYSLVYGLAWNVQGIEAKVEIGNQGKVGVLKYSASDGRFTLVGQQPGLGD